MFVQRFLDQETILDALLSVKNSHPDRIYMSFRGLSGETVLSFESLWQKSEAFAASLPDCDAEGVCLLFLPHGPEMLISFFGAMMRGLIPSIMPVPSAKQHVDIYWDSHKKLFERTQPRFIVTTKAHQENMIARGLSSNETAILDIDTLTPDAPKSYSPGSWNPKAAAFLQHSSGTTGLKKGVMLSHESVMAQVRAYAKSLQLKDGEAIASWLPLYHDMGLITCTILPAVTGTTVWFTDPFVWTARPRLMFEAIQTHKTNLCWMPNFAFEHLSRTIDTARFSFDLSSMRAFINCSEPARPDTMRRFAQKFEGFGVRPEAMQVCYAMAETVFGVTQTPFGEGFDYVKLDQNALQNDLKAVVSETGETEVACTGKAIEGIKLTIRQDEVIVGEGAVGEICIEAPYLMDGYYHLPDVTAERLKDGVYYTRDLGFVLDDKLYVLGRKDDLVIINGRNLYAHEVEALLIGLDGLKRGRSVAFGVFNEAIGSDTLIIVAESEQDSLTEDETASITSQVAEKVMDQTGILPADIVIVPQGWLVKTTSGKISRSANRTKYIDKGN